MKVMEYKQPILITGVERSGSTLIARIFEMCGVKAGICNNMYENIAIANLHNEILQNGELFPPTKGIKIPVNWDDLVLQIYDIEKMGVNWMVKSSLLARYWPIWDYAFPDSKWIIVRRRTGDVIYSCEHTAYMRMFKEVENLVNVGVEDEHAGWLWWVHQYEDKFIEMIHNGLNCRTVWPDRMVFGNYEQMRETVEWLGLTWNPRVPSVISPLLEKSRRTKDGKDDNRRSNQDFG